MISTPDALARLCDRARAHEAVALDTEFVWERTFRPALGVVQVGLGGDDVHLVDTVALAGADLAPLGELLADPETEVVLHDAIQDLQILARATGHRPRSVFDTQRFGGMVGQTASASLQDAVEWASGVRLDKGATRTNWLRRPLTDEQRRYAEDDVRYSLDVRAALIEEAERRQRQGWFREEMALYEDPALYDEPDPMGAVRRVKLKGAKLDARSRAVLRHVAAWREREADRLNRTRRMVLPDEALIEVAQTRPADPRALGSVLTARQARGYADGLLRAVASGEAAPPERRPRRPRLTREEKDRRQRLVRRVQDLVYGICERGGVDPPLAANKSQIVALVEAGGDAAPEAHPVLQGWRREFVGEAILKFLRAEAAA